MQTLELHHIVELGMYEDGATKQMFAKNINGEQFEIILYAEDGPITVHDVDCIGDKV